MNRDIERFYWFTVIDKAEMALLKAVGARKTHWIVDADTLDFHADANTIRGKVDLVACIVTAKHQICTNDILLHYQTDRIVNVINACNRLSGEYPLEMLTENVVITELINRAKEKVLGDKRFVGNEWILNDIEEASRWYLDYLCTESPDKIVDDIRYAKYHLEDYETGQNPVPAYPKSSLAVCWMIVAMLVSFCFSVSNIPLTKVGHLLFLIPGVFLSVLSLGAWFKFMDEKKNYTDSLKKIRPDKKERPS